MKIFGIDNSELFDVKVTSSAQHEEEMGKSDFVRLSWKSNVKYKLQVGTYIIPFEDGLKYRLTEPYEPTQDAEDTFTYQPEFQHPIMWMSKVPFTYATKNTLGEDVVQQEWEYTGQTLTLLQVVVDFINTAFGFADNEKFSLTPVGSIDTNVSVSFSSTDVLSAISSIASACKENKCEYCLSWKHKALYFGQVNVNLGEEIPTLKVGENVGKASVSESSDGYYNVFYPQGSTRNMSVKAASGENVSTGIRLGLDKTKYPNGEIDTRTNANEPKQTLALTFDDIYPHVNCYVYNVRSRTRYLLDDNNEKVVSSYNADGSVKEYKKYTVWYMRLAYPLTKQISGKTPVATTSETLDGKTQTLYWYDYVVEDSQIIDGYTLCGSFSVNTNDGALASSLVAQPSNSDGFELIFHKTAQTISANSTTGDSGVSILAGDFEIVFVNQNETIIPTNESEGLIPRGPKTPTTKGNIVILYNIAMGDDEVTAAQDELEEKTLAEIAYRHSDRNNYTFSAYPNVWAKSNPNLYIGQRVVYDDGNGYSYTTRVMKLVTNLDYDIVQEITVGNAEIKGSVSQLKEDVRGLINGTVSVGSGLSYDQVLNIVKNYVQTRYLSRTHADTAAGLITFLNGLSLGDGTYSITETGAATLLSLLINGKYGIDKDGLGTLARLVADELKSSDFKQGYIDGAGFGLYKDGGKSYAEVDNLIVRMRAVFAELEVRKLSYVGGDQVHSFAGSQIAMVKPIDKDGNEITDGSTPDSYKCYYLDDDGTTRTQNWWKTGDQARCQTFDIQSGVYKDVSNRYYWRLVIGTGEEDVVTGTEEVTTTDSEGNATTVTQNVTKHMGYVILSNRSDGFFLKSDGTYPTLGDDGFPSKDSDGNYDAICNNGQPIVFIGKDTANDNDAPAAEDKIVQLGSQCDADRSYAVVIYVTEQRTSYYYGISSYSLDGHEVQRNSPHGSWVYTKWFEMRVGDPDDWHPVVNYRGNYTSGISYGYYDAVTNNGLMWLCTNADGTTEEPCWGCKDWTVTNGDTVMDMRFYDASGHLITHAEQYPDSVNIYLAPHLFFGQEDITEKIGDSAWAWTRYTGEYGEETDSRTTAQQQSDLGWPKLHWTDGSMTRNIRITNDDMPDQWGDGVKVNFIITATVDGESYDNYVSV